MRHRLADALVSVEAAGALLDAAWEDPSPVSARMAKAFAGRSARTAARHCQQVLAGIGFTTEHPLHLFVRRTMVLDQFFGAGSTLTRLPGYAGILSRTPRCPRPFPSENAGRFASHRVGCFSSLIVFGTSRPGA